MAKEKSTSETQAQRSVPAAQHRKVIGERQRSQDIDRAAKDRKFRATTRAQSFKGKSRSHPDSTEFTTTGLYLTVLGGILVCAAFLYWTVVLAIPPEEA